MFDDYKIVFCRNCTHAVFPNETAPWGTCCEPTKNKTIICKTVARSCNKISWKDKQNGKDEQRSNNEDLQGD